MSYIRGGAVSIIIVVNGLKEGCKHPLYIFRAYSSHLISSFVNVEVTLLVSYSLSS